MTVRNRISALTKAVAALPCPACGRRGAPEPPFEAAPEYHIPTLTRVLPRFGGCERTIQVDWIGAPARARSREIWKRGWPVLSAEVQGIVRALHARCSTECPGCGRVALTSVKALSGFEIGFLNYVLGVALWRACFPEFKPPEGLIIFGTEPFFR